MKRFILIISALLLVGAIDVSARPKKLTKTITWELDKNGTLTIQGYGAMPSQENWRKLPWFKWCDAIKRVVINPGITSIGSWTFIGYSNLTSITIPNSVTKIGSYAFCGGNLTSITIPDSVTSIESNAFVECKPTSVTIPNSVTSFGRSIFSSCKGELFVDCNIPRVSYADYAPFGHSDFSKITFGDNVRRIGEHAFYCCNEIKSITFGDNIQSIGHYAFTKGKGKDNQFGTADDVLYNGEITNLPHFITAANCENIGISLSAYKRAVGPSCHDYYKQAEALQPQEAVKLYIKGANAKEEPGELYTRKDCYAAAGKCYIALKQNANALNIFKRAKALGYDGFDSDIKSLEKLMLKDKAQKALSNGDYDLALKYYFEAGDWDSMFAVPEYFVKKEDYQNAIRYYHKIENDYDSQDARLRLADIYFNHLNNFDEAFKYYLLHYIILQANSTENLIDAMLLVAAFNEVCKVPKYFEDKKDFKNAIMYYQKAYEETKHSDIAFRIAQLYEKMKNKNMAISWYKKSAEKGHNEAIEALTKYGIIIDSKHNSQEDFDILDLFGF